MRFCKCVPVAFSSVSIYKTRSRRQNTLPSLLVVIKFVKTRPRRKILSFSLKTAWIIDVIVRFCVLVFLGAAQVPKRSEIYQGMDFL